MADRARIVIVARSDVIEPRPDHPRSCSGPTFATTWHRWFSIGTRSGTEKMMHTVGSQTFGKARFSVFLFAILLATLVLGCSRSHYRRRADAESYGVLEEKSNGTPWEVPFGFMLEPDPRSRLFDPSDPDDPALPLDGPELYVYQIPELYSDTEASGVSHDTLLGPQGLASAEAPPSKVGEVQLVSAVAQPPGAGDSSMIHSDGPNLHDPPPTPDPSAEAVTRNAFGVQGVGALPIVPISKAFWDPIPAQCLLRMLEFETVREEYRRSFGADPDASLRDASRKLTLENIVELALLNSREYQAQKERLYQAALALTLERFDYDLKFSPFGNGVDVGYTHARSGGTTVNTLGIPTNFQVERILATGGNLLARFSNDVLLTFNGPNGFAADISSELLLSISQTVFQRDAVLNPLIQAEREVVYAARDFARFRKTFFFELASDYYRLILTYRQIEIGSQNYYSLVRNLNQRQAEARADIRGAQSPIQIDQIEQEVLSGRSGLISTCNSLEQGLDRLKITLGIPTETPLNLNLRELEELTLSDEIDVSGELVRRAQRRLEAIRSGPVTAKPEPVADRIESLENQSESLNASIVLVQRLEEWLRLREQRGHSDSERKLLEVSGAFFHVAEARLGVDRNRFELEVAQTAQPPSPPIQLIQRVLELADSLIELIDRQAVFASLKNGDQDEITSVAETNHRLRERAVMLREQFSAGLLQEQLAQIEEQLQNTEALLLEIEALAQAAELLLGAAQRPEEDDVFGDTFKQIEQLRVRTEELLQGTHQGLLPVDISVDEAMATALMQRLDLMNERGFLADDWRDVKIAADDLKSVLNLNAEQSIRTRKNRPFGFTFNDSRTDLDLSLDLPLNRKSQRNIFRRVLINFQASLRSLTRSEDDIKFEVRTELRNIDLRRVQYEISVASAALAFVRVLSTELELALGIENVGARDFLEAQDAYRRALVGVASDHIDYIVARAQLFLDLELLVLDSSGFWSEIRNEALQPAFNQQYPIDAGPLYGEMPEFLKISCEIERMRCVPYPRGPLEYAEDAQPALEDASSPGAFLEPARIGP